MALYILVVLSAFVIAFLLTPLAIKAAFKLGAIDKPDPGYFCGLYDRHPAGNLG